MKNTFNKSIASDALTGIIFALEGIRNVVVLLNGPMGCKFYHSTTSQFLDLRPPLYLPVSEDGKKMPVSYNFLNDWFFRQSRVPCTYLDGHDYVYGTEEKVTEGIRYLKKHVDFDLIAVVNAPGASLIGDNLKEICEGVMKEGSRIVPCVIIESPGYSESFESGYEMAFIELLRQVGPELWKRKNIKAIAEHIKSESNEQTQSSSADIKIARHTCEKDGSGFKDGSNTCEKDGSGFKDGSELKNDEQGCRKKSVNLLGLSIWHRYWEGDLQELKRLFHLCGIGINACPLVGTPLSDITDLPKADLNVVLYPEMGQKAAMYLQETIGTPTLVLDGPPIGFDAVQEMFEKICETLGSDISLLIEEINRARAIAWYKINGIHEMYGLPDGAKFRVEASSSLAKALRRFLTEYLGMESDEQEDVFETDAELVFADANVIAGLKANNKVFCGIEISQPGMGYVDLLPKTQMGIQGSLFLIEQVLNGLMTKL